MERYDYRNKFVLGFDPSGAFAESGKGTTGWNVMCCRTKEIMAHGEISAKDFKRAEEYWFEHRELIRRMFKQYKGLGITIESYRLYAKQAQAQINSSFETSQLIGYLRMVAYEYGIDVRMHTAQLVKTRCTDEILAMKLLLPENISGHILDSIRHSYYFSLFECFY